MRVVIQRVQEASVVVDGKEVSRIDQGVLSLFGVQSGDDESQVEKMIQKIVALRIFEDEQGKMNRSLLDIGGQHLIVSQFTLLGDCAKGRRPSFLDAEKPDRANELYEYAVKVSQGFGVVTQGGVFQADMKVSLVNDGPVTFVLEL